MTITKPALLGLGLTLLLGACDDDEESVETRDSSAPDSSTSDAAASDAASDRLDATVDGGLDASYIPTDAAALPDSGFCPAERFPDGAVAYQEYPVTLTTAAEVPACASAGPAAAGSAKVVFSCIDPSFYVTDLTVQNLSSTVQAAHIHFGAAGSAGPVVINLEPTNTGFGNGTGSAATYQAKAGAPPTFDAFLTELRAGKAYINVHTTDCPSGEIRGQIPGH